MKFTETFDEFRRRMIDAGPSEYIWSVAKEYEKLSTQSW